MEEEKLVEKLRFRLLHELPGLSSQLVASPPFRVNSFSKEDVLEARKASVVWLMYPCDDGWEGVLILRSPYDGVHSGQVALPGGERDECNESDLETAIRECDEEIGVSVKRDQIVGVLSPIYIPPSKFFVRPYFACLDSKPEFVLDEVEVSKVLFLKLKRLCSKELWSKYKMNGVEVPGFELDGNVVWGATAMMLAEISDCCRDIFIDTFA
jgi:8-oxo-dGTP pyrophosphatase MutT (NUDIX family)